MIWQVKESGFSMRSHQLSPCIPCLFTGAMGYEWSPCHLLVHLPFYLIVSCSLSFNALPIQFSAPAVANLSTSWINIPSNILLNETANYEAHIGNLGRLRIVLYRESSGTSFVCGFHCTGNETVNGTRCLFGISISPNVTHGDYAAYTKLVWSANQGKPVKVNAILQLNREGDLILADHDGSFVWSTNTSGKSVSGLNLTDQGNLVLFDEQNHPVWQSFRHPTNSLVPGQMLTSGLKLTASLFSLEVKGQGVVAYMDSDPSQVYYQSMDFPFVQECYAQYRKDTLDGFMLPSSSSPGFVKLEIDGHFKVHQWTGSFWKEAADLLTTERGKCIYPTVCGKYGICWDGQCSCPETSTGDKIYFRRFNNQQPSEGCYATMPLACELSRYHSFLELEDAYYFSSNVDIKDTDEESCKQVCLQNCSCKAAIFVSWLHPLSGNCSLLPEVFSLSYDPRLGTNFSGYQSSVFLKVQNPPPIGKKKRNIYRAVWFIVLPLVAAFILFHVIVACYFGRKQNGYQEVEEDHLDHIPGMPTRFSYEDLEASTEDFSCKIGQGGFGSVFLGTLSGGVKVAVKQLDGFKQVKKSFLAELETIGSIHHLNLVRLIGYCAEKSSRLLVYEYMSKGSLDTWLFCRNREPALNWQTRKRIILGIAKGLAYLHEECRQKIVHLDIKPQNVLLDESFNAKVSDFGLSKLIDREQSKFLTTMRGTPGYMAPEWLSSVITEKVDVYSFGIVVLEILCGRRIFDQSQTEEDMHLLNIFSRKAEENQLLDIVDRQSEDMQLHRTEAVEMMRTVAWCLRSDFTKRPSMSTVVKTLEGLAVEGSLQFDFSNPLQRFGQGEEAADATPLIPSILSAAR